MPGLLLLLILAGTDAAAQSIRFLALERKVIDQRLETVTRENPERLSTLRRLFEETGCREDRLSEQLVKAVKLPNLVCTVKGQTDATIVVGAHYDMHGKGTGAVDNWSGAALLPSLMQSLTQQPRRHTFVFVGFAAEELGLVGSRTYINQLSTAEARRISAMVNIDCVGTGLTRVELSRGHQKLVEGLWMVAQTLKLPLSPKDLSAYGTSDFEAFGDRRIPFVSVHSLTKETTRLLHSRRDTLEAIKRDEYYDTYRLLAAYLAWLDEAL